MKVGQRVCPACHRKEAKHAADCSRTDCPCRREPTATQPTDAAHESLGEGCTHTIPVRYDDN